MKTTLLFLIAFSFTVFSQQNFWEQTNGPYGGRIISQAINSKGYIFVGTGVGIFRSTDHGDNWEEINNGLNDFKSINVNTIVINSNDIILINTNGGLFNSLDDGEHWTELNLPGEQGFQLFIHSSSNIFFGQDGRGKLYRSIDNGNTWIDISNKGLPAPSYSPGLAVNSRGEIYVGMVNRGIFKSTDYGDSWNIVVDNDFGGNYDTLAIEITAISINSDDEIFVGAHYQSLPVILKSTNNGTSWVLDTVHNTYNSIFSIAFNSENNIFLATYPEGIYRSTDGGNNWDHLYVITNGNVSSNILIDNDNIYVGTDNGVFISKDNGYNWSQIGVTASSIGALSINSNDDIFASSSGGFYRSTNLGNTWDRINDTLSFSKIAFNSLDYIYAGTSTSNDVANIESNNDGIFMSTDYGDNWTKVYDYNNSDTAIYSTGSIAVSPNGHIFAGIHKYFPHYHDPDQEDYDYSSVGTIYKSTDNGKSWNATSYSQGGPLEGGVISSLVINSDGIIFASRGNGYLYGNGYVYRSTDDGDNWTVVDNGLPGNPYPVISMAINSKGDIFAGIEYTGLTGDVFKSTDNGDHWEKTGFANTGFPQNYNHVYELAVNSSDRVFAVTYNGIYQSSDNGDSWGEMNIGLDYYHNVVTALAINSKDYLFAGTNGRGVFISMDSSDVPVELLSLNGKVFNKTVQLKWSTATELNNKGFEIQRKTSDPNKKDLSWYPIGFVNGNGTTTDQKTYSFIDKSISSGKYLYRLKQIDFDGTFTYSKEIEINFEVPLAFNLAQNYPNPFNPTTTIKYSLPEDSNVKLTLINSLGEKVMDLVNGKVNSGNHEVKINGSNLASGIYFYRLEIEKYTATKKLILLK